MGYNPGYYECESCGLATGPVDDDVEGEEDLPIPAGWLEITIRQKVPNPSYLEQKNLQGQLIEQQVSATQAMVEQQGQDVPTADIRELAQVQISLQYPVHAPEYVVEEATVHFCQNPQCQARVSALGGEASEVAEPPPQKAPEPEATAAPEPSPAPSQGGDEASP